MNQLRTLIDTYSPSQATTTLVQEAQIVLLVGISGAGKDTIKKRLLAQGGFYDIVSHTTRAPRVNNGQPEVDGVDYHFVTDNQVTDMLHQQAFIEAKYVHGTVYGTSVAELTKAQQLGKVAITDIDVQGVAEYKEIAPHTVAIFLLPPDFVTWQQRLKQRYASEEDFLVEWPKRRASAITELERALMVPYYHFVVNDDLELATHVVGKIATKPDLFTRKDDEARLAARDILVEIQRHRG